jgi:hypothetical protein
LMVERESAETSRSWKSTLLSLPLPTLRLRW